MSKDDPAGVDQLPAAVPSRSKWGRLPLIWILPIVVVLAGGFVVIHERVAQGITVQIKFLNAEGLEANKTKIRYKNVEIGEVSDISVAKDRKEVIVKADIQRKAKEYMVSGEYISVDVGTATERRDQFVGLEAPPILTADLPGREFVLHAADLGSLSVGSSVYFRHITAGQVVGYSMDPGGTGVTINTFINAPFDSYVNGSTRFWQASGVDMSVTSDGVKLHTESLTTILEGGVAFQTLPGAAVTAVRADTSFTLYPDEDRAMRPVETEIRTFVMYFQGSLRGLSGGAPVELHGINVGEVKTLDVEFDQNTGLLRFPVIIEIYPQRIHGRTARNGRAASTTANSDNASRQLLDNLVKHGLRAELKTGNLLTGQKFVALDMHEDAPSDRIAWTETPIIFPTISSSLDDLQDSIGSIARKLNKVPFDQLGFRLSSTLAALEQTLKSADQMLQGVNTELAPQVRATLAEAQAAMKNAKDLLAQDAPLQSDLGSTLMQVSRAAKSINALVDFLQRHPESLLRGKPKDSP